MTSNRVQRAQAWMQSNGIEGLFVGPSSDLRYLVGYHALPLERLTLLVLPADGPAGLVVPGLEEARALASGAGEHASVRTWDETQDPLDQVLACLVDAGATGDGVWALQDQMWASFALRLQARLPEATWVEGNTVMTPLRIIKAPDEVAALREVGAAIDAVHAKVPGLLRPGRREDEVGRDIAELIHREHDEVNFVIVASGPNGASPHHETGARRLEEGDAVVVDIGGTLDGYCSDETRNYAIGAAPSDYAQMHEVLLAAQQASTHSVRPGVTAESVDAAARDVLVEAGLGEAFIHRTGHGIGVDEHEEPYIVAGSQRVLEAGMAFSIEPGFYLPGRFGARIEDIVVVTEDGVEVLNHRPRELHVV